MMDGCNQGWLKVITPSMWSAMAFKKVGLLNHVHVIPHGVDLTKMRPKRYTNGFVFLSVGACTGNKGLDVLIA